jgi:hypothetical protein
MYLYFYWEYITPDKLLERTYIIVSCMRISKAHLPYVLEYVTPCAGNLMEEKSCVRMPEFPPPAYDYRKYIENII